MDQVAQMKNPAVVKNYRMWHQKDPDRIVTRSYTFPKTVCVMGVATDICYASDKWEADGDFFDYTHCFDSRPFLYHVDGVGRSKDVCRLLGVRSLNGDIPLTALAHVKSLSIDVDKLGARELDFGSEKPLMACTPDKKTLVIFAVAGPFFVTGKEMRVTERGIVK